MAGIDMNGFGRIPIFSGKTGMFGNGTVPELPSAFASPPGVGEKVQPYINDLRQYAKANAPGDPTAKWWASHYGKALQDGWRPAAPSDGAGAGGLGPPLFETSEPGVQPPMSSGLGPLPPEFLPGQLPVSELNAISQFWSPPQAQASPIVATRTAMPPQPTTNGDLFNDPMAVVSNSLSSRASGTARPVAAPQTRAVKRK